jgi:hypothetical protein
MDTPAVKTACGVAAAATTGCFLLGPVGLLIGAAAVGIGVGVMQIPEEQRMNMQEKATEACKGAHEHVITVSEAISNSCATTYTESGIADHVPAEVKQCCEVIDEKVTNVVSQQPQQSQHSKHSSNNNYVDDDDEVVEETTNDAANNNNSNSTANLSSTQKLKRELVVNPSNGTSFGGDPKSTLSPTRLREKKDKVACLREGKRVYAV